MAPPSAELPRYAYVGLPIMGVVLSGRLTLSPSIESTSIFSAEYSCLIQLGVEYLTIGRIAPLSGVIFFDQQYWLKVEKGGRILPCKDDWYDIAESWC